MNRELDKDVAKAVMAHVENSGQSLSALGEELRKIDDPALRRESLQFVGEAMADLYIKIMRPIIEAYPELDPDKLADL